LKFGKWLYFLIVSKVLRSGKKLDQQPTMSAENFAELSRLVKVLAEKIDHWKLSAKAAMMKYMRN